MSIEDDKAVAGRWFTRFWDADFNPVAIDDVAPPASGLNTHCTRRAAAGRKRVS